MHRSRNQKAPDEIDTDEEVTELKKPIAAENFNRPEFKEVVNAMFDRISEK